MRAIIRVRIAVIEEDFRLDPHAPAGLAHPIANALHRSIGGYWTISPGARVAYELFSPFRMVPLSNDVALFLEKRRADQKRRRKSKAQKAQQEQPELFTLELFTFEIPNVFTPSPTTASSTDVPQALPDASLGNASNLNTPNSSQEQWHPS